MPAAWASPTAFTTRPNRGVVCVGISHDTPAFAAHSVATWWKREAWRCYGRVPKLLVLADSGGSNSCTSWAWKTEIQAPVCNAFGLTATIAHYPTGASKWIPIEHRLFSEISKNWVAEPLDNYEKMLNFIRNTRTQTGLAVTAYLDRKEYPTGVKPDPHLISSLRLKHSDTLPMELHHCAESVKLILRRPLALATVSLGLRKTSALVKRIVRMPWDSSTHLSRCAS
jgi:hypothetical protein